MKCIFCLKFLKNENFHTVDDVTKEILEVLLLSHCLKKETSSKFCNECKINIGKAFEFKSQCILTEDMLVPYRTDSGNLNVDNVYFKEYNKKVSFRKESICRLCFKVVNRLEAEPLKKALAKFSFETMFKENFQELKIRVNGAKICFKCFKELKSFSEFINLGGKSKDENSIGILPIVRHSTTGISGKEIAKKMRASKEILSDSNSTLSISKLVMERPFQCRFCDIRYKTKSQCTRHEGTVHLGKTHECPICHCILSRSDVLRTHMKTKHGSSKHKCDVCNFTTTARRSLRKHLLIHTGLKHLSCDRCDYKTSRSDSLKRHMQIHKPQEDVTYFKCNSCVFKTRYKDALLSHFLVHVESKESKRKFSCSICQKKISYYKFLVEHHKYDHNGGNVVKCEFCEFETVNKKSLINHQRNRHTSVLKFKTDLKSTLVDVTHKNVNMFNCDACDFKAYTELAMRRHKFREHKGFQTLRLNDK